MHLRQSIGILASLAFVLAACPDDGDGNEDATTETGQYADIVITQTQCDYHAECVAILGDTVASCRVARCEEGTCVAALAPAGVTCDGAQGLGECEQGMCNAAGNCVAATALDGVACDSGSWTKCTGNRCTGGVCSSFPLVACDDKNACTTDMCSESTGSCEYTNTVAPCDDGNVCTGGDACADGLCVGTENLCQCEADADCASYDDGDLCNGVFFCDNGICAPEANSEVTCADDGTVPICQENTCNSATGQCEIGNVADYVKCDDGEVCTGCAASDPDCATGDFCQAGTCKAGPGKPCSCAVTADCLQFEDGDACNGTLTCDAEICVVDTATVVDCSTETAPECSILECTPATGVCDVVVPSEDGATCDDLDACTGGEICTGGSCGGGTDNGACDCTVDADCAALDDGDMCNGGFVCNTATSLCEADATVVDCTGQVADDCNTLECNPASGVCDVATPVTDATVCDDADSCTSGETCTAGVCGGGTDNGTCVACTMDSECEGLDDGDKCNGVFTCNTTSGLCEEDATPVDCTGQVSDQCNTLECDTTTGACSVVTPVADGIDCDDADSCTDLDRCQAGVCAGTDTCSCTLDTDCTTGGLNYCVATECVECKTGSHLGCSGTTPYCETGANACGSCSLAGVPDTFCDIISAGTTCNLATGACE